MARQKKQSKTWVYTINNYTDADEAQFQDMEYNYCVYGRELSDSGTPHMQGYVIFKRNYTLKQLKKIHKEAHWEMAKAVDAMNYCFKDKNYFKKDNRNQGARTDISDAMALALEGKMEEVRDQFPSCWLKYNHALREAHKERNFIVIKPGAFKKPIVTWLYGETGSGKTRYVFQKHDARDIYNALYVNNFFVGFRGQPVILFDDFRKDTMKFQFLLQVLDRYPMEANTKHGSTD